MATVESIIEHQQQLFGLISRTVKNMEKLGSSKITRGVIKSRIDVLKSNWDKFTSNHASLIRSCSSEQKRSPYFKDDLYSTCEEKFLDAHSTMLDMLDNLDPANQSTSVADVSLNASTVSRSRRLPRIDLPKFSGDYSQWSHFRDLFTSMIINNTDVSAVEKLHYLKMSLSGEPSQHLKSISISGENFTRAWDNLVARYENKRILVNAQLTFLFATKKVKTENAADLKRLLGDLKEALGALDALKCPVRHWDVIIIFIVTRKLDSESLKRWEDSLGAQPETPSLADFEAFLVGRIYTLEALERSMPQRQHQATTTSRPSGARSYTAAATEQKCLLCSSGHYLSSCPKYLEKSYEQRRGLITSKNLCFNCLGPHQVKVCRNTKRCRTCQKQHHTTLHAPTGNSDVSTISTATSSATPTSTSVTASQVNAQSSVHPTKQLVDSQISSHLAQSRLLRRAPVLLATATVNVLSRHGQPQSLRALLDQGSEVSFISEYAAQSLMLPRRAAAIPILGIGAQRNSVSNGVTSLTIISRINSNFRIETEALVLPKLTAYLPPAQVKYNQWSHLHGLHLADPDFGIPGKIDLILGANVYAQILEDGLCRGNDNEPIAQKTTLGWILSGPLPESNLAASNSGSSFVTGMQCSLDLELLDSLQRFWTQEEISHSSQTSLTPEESQCESHFEATHSRDPNGRFIVKLPLKREVTDFGDSRFLALKALLRMESRFKSNPALKSSYIAFLTEYRDLDHMRLIKSSDRHQPRKFFLPHHGVIRETSSTTKLRVVFNGSQKTNLNFSLNDVLHIGPKLQTDLTSIITRWRRHQYVFAADIEKMYRQIRVHKDDWPLQQILWREEASEPLQDYQLCTVTYGLACAPYLALRCLHQLALESDASRPLAAEILRRDTYVDDILSGASESSQVRHQIQQLNETLTAGGFKLRKWIANHSDLLAAIPPQDQESSSSLSVEDGPTHYTLGIRWNRHSDHFFFSAPSSPQTAVSTKRAVLSFISRMFDPLGWLAPITIVAKIFMQDLWAIRLNWDEELPENLNARWTRFRQQLEDVKTISIPRWFGTNNSALAMELHGFSDASQHALAAVIYIRMLSDLDDIRVTLVSAKTKVAPLKRMTVPRLELSAAVLLVRQISKIREFLDLHHVPVHCWIDSTVALTWIKSHPARWKEFIQNRVTIIQELSNSRWHHVPGVANPADLASRGLSPKSLQQEQLWWTGPSWLQNHSTSWPSRTPVLDSTVSLEERPATSNLAAEQSEPAIWDLIDRYSSLTSLLRTTAWLNRARNCFQKSLARSPHSTLTPAELDSSLLFWVKLVQHAHFSEEIRKLETNKSLSSSSSLLRLSPFLDSTNLLRLRGRLQFSQLDYSERHPLILPRHSQLTTLVINHYHRLTLHGGPQLTLTSIRRKFWILGGRAPVRSFIHKCVTCARQRMTTGRQLIGPLPSSRVIPRRSFFHTGVDYAGPLILKTFRGRGAKTYKGYFIIFICLTTSAIHLEVATDYSTDGFIAAYKRFTGRRGLCSTLSSDCGTNLIGADSELKRMFTSASKEWAQIATLLANDGVTWRFNPPSAPHFGGKWEAGVKSVKYHLRRVIGNAILTYEDLTTLLTQIEAILNSRPLCVLSDDPSDVSALTPGHFLVGSALITVPEPSLQEIPINRLSQLQLLRQMTESFWRRWSSEYLHQLQTSSKWHRQEENLKPGNIVLIKDERMPPTKWPLARIIDVHPGADGLVRVVTVKTATSVLKRPIVKLCKLPILDETDISHQ